MVPRASISDERAQETEPQKPLSLPNVRIGSPVGAAGFPLKTCGNDNYSLGCVLEMASTAFAATARRIDYTALDFNEQISLFEFKHGKDYA